MSLINQMLHDLDRRGSREIRSPGYVVAGLHSPYAAIHSLTDNQRMSTLKLILMGMLTLSLLVVIWRYMTITSNAFTTPPISVASHMPGIKRPVIADTGVPDATESEEENNQIERIVENTQQMRTPVLAGMANAGLERKTVTDNRPMQISTLMANATPSVNEDHGDSKSTRPIRDQKNSQPDNPVNDRRGAVITKTRVAHHAEQHPPQPAKAAGEQNPDGSLRKKFRPATDQQLAEDAFMRGIADIQRGDINKGVEQMRNALSYDAKHIKAREMLAGLMIKQGQNTQAANILRKGIELHPGYDQYTKLYSRILIDENNNQEALRVLEANKPSFNSDPDYYAILAAVNQKLNRFQQAADIYSQLVTLQPNSGIYWMGLGISLEGSGHSTEAMDAFEYAIQTGGLKPDLVHYISSRINAIRNKPG